MQMNVTVKSISRSLSPVLTTEKRARDVCDIGNRFLPITLNPHGQFSDDSVNVTINQA